MNIDMNTWIVSDTHFRHANIVRYAHRPMNHDNIMADNWKELVQPDDTVLHLGDLHVWYNEIWLEEAKEIILGLPGKKYLILGNHDKKPNQWYENLGFEIVPDQTVNFKGKNVHFSHYPDTSGAKWHTNVHGHIHTNGYPPEADPQRDFRNVSIEVMDYKPVRLHDVLYNGRYASHKELGFDTDKIRKQRR